MTAFTFRMPAGIPGAINRPDQATVEPVALDSTHPFSQYGRFGKTSNTGLFIPLVANDAAAVITGMLARPFPTNAGTDGLGTSTPPQTGGIGDRLKRGYMTVALNWGAAIKDAQVYVCNVATGSQVVGDIGADNLGGDAVAVVGAFFTGPSDTSGAATDVVGQVEIAFNL
jgi:hypothetical protein